MNNLVRKIEELCNKKDIEFLGIYLDGKCIDVRLPYDVAIIEVEFEGETNEEILESFKDGVNYRLDEMINHLEDCKFD